MTLYDIAVEQNKEIGSKSSSDIVSYMRSKGAMTYTELLASQSSSGIPLARSVRANIKNTGIASLSRRKTVRLGGKARKTRKTRKSHKRT